MWCAAVILERDAASSCCGWSSVCAELRAARRMGVVRSSDFWNVMLPHLAVVSPLYLRI